MYVEEQDYLVQNKSVSLLQIHTELQIKKPLKAINLMWNKLLNFDFLVHPVHV